MCQRTPWRSSPRHVRPARHPRSARPGAVAASRRQLLRPGTVTSARSSACSRAARATSATRSPSPRWATIYALPQESEGRALLRTPRRAAAGLERLPASPGGDAARPRQHRHRNIVCPLHRWTYDLGGQLIGAPHFADDPCRDLPTIRSRPGTAWCSTCRIGAPRRDVAAELAGIGPARELDFTGYVFDSVKLHECDYNWKTFIEVYLEDYHVAPFHPGLGQFVTCEDLRWEFGAAPLGADRRPEERARQAGLARLPQVARRRARLPRGPLRRPRAAPRRDLADLLPGDDGRVVPARAGRLDAGARRGRRRRSTSSSSTIPRTSTPSSASSSRPSRRRTGRPAPRTTRSRCAWTPAGAPSSSAASDDFGPYQSPMEDGMQQFHEWYQKAMR